MKLRLLEIKVFNFLQLMYMVVVLHICLIIIIISI
jgi:hypothetical protein